MKALIYNPNSPFYVNRALEKAERRLEEMKIRRDLYLIDQKLNQLAALEWLYAPPKAST